jgi:hypothetical protein
MPDREEVEELKEMVRQFHRVLDKIQAWPTDDDEYRGLIAELRQLQRRLDEKLPPATDPLRP